MMRSPDIAFDFYKVSEQDARTKTIIREKARSAKLALP
jgi:hypothetical protein